MVDKPKKKSAKAKQQQGVLGGLPAERPARIGTRGAAGGARKAAAPRTFEPTEAAEAAATPDPAPAKPAAASDPTPAKLAAASGPTPPKPAAASSPAPAPAKPRRTAPARRKAAAPRTFEPTEAAKSAAANGDAAPAKPRRATRPRRKAAAPRTFEPTQAAATAAAEPPPPAEPKPRPVRAAVPRMRTGDRGRQAPEPERTSGTELVTNAIQAAGEVAQVGLTIGGRLLKRALGRVPRP
jgi:ribonuclease E